MVSAVEPQTGGGYQRPEQDQYLKESANTEPD
jgi:hypothetical protein